ncbi:MAG TPA: CPBP family intramembrane glutamic endopeptidase [Candidatus Limnocylindrales bacterium]|nr:CPBP family intramembrane glutamic endopeptidase [Candidatus Limnocylindrales bacterium]
MTGGAEPSPSEAPAAGTPPGPPGARVFSLEGRPAAGLYLLGWLLSLAGAGLFFVAIFASDRGAAIALSVVALLLLALGLAAAAGYQLLARAGRPAERYRGPSPAILFGLTFALGNAIMLVLGPAGLIDPRHPFGFLAALLIVAALYVLVVLVFAVRAGALGRADLGLPSGAAARPARLVEDILFALAVALPATIGGLLVAGVVGLLLDVRAPRAFPLPSTPAEALVVAIGVVLVAPIGEEVFFRGFAVSAWRRDLGARSALVRSAVFFGLVHIANIDAATFAEGAKQAILELIVIVPLGLVLGWLFLRRGLVAAIAGHVVYNGLLLALLALALSSGAVPGG